MIPRNTLLTDNVIALRPAGVEDTCALVDAVQESVGEIMPWMDWCTPEYDEDTARGWLASLPPSWDAGNRYAFAITDAADGRFLGCAGLNHINRFYRMANLGYWVRTSATGGGVATRAARLVARFGFEKLGLLRAEIVVAVGNKASLRVAEKAGAKREGVLRNRLRVGELVLEAVMHSLTPQDFGIPLS